MVFYSFFIEVETQKMEFEMRNTKAKFSFANVMYCFNSSSYRDIKGKFRVFH